MTAAVTFTWNAEGGDDRITVETDADHVAVPPVLTLPEDAQGLIVIYPLNAVGF